MSASEFSSALKNRVLRDWFSREQAGGGSPSKLSQDAYRLSNINLLANPASIYRSSEQTSEKTSFIITKDTVSDLIRQYHNVTDSEVLSDLTAKYFSAFKATNVGVAVDRKLISVGNDLPAVYFPNISFDSITKLVTSVMGIKSDELASHYEKGHITGITTELLQTTSDRMSAVDTDDTKGKAFLIAQLDRVIAYYKRLDLESSNLGKSGEVKLYASVEKSLSKDGKTKYLVELQPKAMNQNSGKEVQATIGSIRKLFSPAALTEQTIISTIAKLQAGVSDPKFQQDLLEMKSSPSYKEMLAKLILDVLNDVPSDQAFSHKNLLVTKVKPVTVDLSKVKAEAKKQVAAANKAKAALNKTTKLRTRKGQFYSLASLVNLLNSKLSDQIKKNMGSGNRTDILNLRTGRLAESAVVTRATQSRAGMITAFYTYMRNPYGTFSTGGKQEFPKSRDPKLLISKSIREIASEQVANRMRAVLA